MSEITGMLAWELERLREEDRLREERLTSLVTHLTQELEAQRKRDEDLTGQLQQFADRLNELERLSPGGHGR